MTAFGSGGSFESSRAAHFIKVRACLLSKKCGTKRNLRGMSGNFGEAAMGEGKGVSKIAAKDHFKRRGEFVDHP